MRLEAGGDDTLERDSGGSIRRLLGPVPLDGLRLLPQVPILDLPSRRLLVNLLHRSGRVRHPARMSTGRSRGSRLLSDLLVQGAHVGLCCGSLDICPGTPEPLRQLPLKVQRVVEGLEQTSDIQPARRRCNGVGVHAGPAKEKGISRAATGLTPRPARPVWRRLAPW